MSRDRAHRIARINGQERAWQEAKAEVYGRVLAVWETPAVQVVAALGAMAGAVWAGTHVTF